MAQFLTAMKKKEVRPAEETSRLIRKANELVEARYRYDIWQTRVFAKVLTLIKPSDTDFYEYKIYLTEFIKEFGLKKGGNIYQLIKSGAEGLMQKKVVVDELLDGRPSELQTWMLSSVQTFKETDDAAYLLVTIHPKLKPYLLELRQKYLVYDIRNVLKLTSVYSIRIYELLKQYEKIGKRHFDLENLKLILGIQPEEYKLYGHFKSKVILKAQSDLSAETDISFTFEEHKSGKKVSGVTFFIFQNAERRSKRELAAEFPVLKKTDKAAMLDSPFFRETLDVVRLWGVSDMKLRELFVEHGEEQVREGMQCTLDSEKEHKITGNIGGFFVRAVSEGWKSARQTKQQRAADRRRQSEIEMVETRKELEKQEAILDSILEARREAVNEVVRSLTMADSALAENAVQGILANQLTKSLLEKSVGRTLDQLEMDDWRYDKTLREAVVRQIERMFPSEFAAIQAEFDKPVGQVRKSINTLRDRVGERSAA